MAFKKTAFSTRAAADPAAHFKTLTKREYPDVMPHQKDILEEYARNHEETPDLALQLPTGSGKTLVGLLIAEWRRVKRGDRAVYLCPTRQLVRQTATQAQEKYGIDVVDLSGKKREFSPGDIAAFKTGKSVAVTTYSSLFNARPFFENPDLIIIDDAHAAENYIAKMWSLSVSHDTPLYGALVEFFKPQIDQQEYSRLTGDWVGLYAESWVEKIASPKLDLISDELVAIVDAHSSPEHPELHYPWSLIRDHLDGCHVYLGTREILIRPMIPPTFTHAPYAGASQRVFMSATLGSGGDLERLTGRKSIRRLAAPEGFQSAGVGRRYFIFPSLSLNGEETSRLRMTLQEQAGRSVILTPASSSAAAHIKAIQEYMNGFDVFTKDDIEADKAPFVTSERACAVLANRYDGIDFPGDECRFLCVDGLPQATNGQERFLMSRMSAGALYNERLQARVLQAIGRCTRALQDRAAIFVTGTELVDFLADDRKWKNFPPELQAELAFGVEQSKDVSSADIAENFEMFISNSSDWISVDGDIRAAIPEFSQIEYPAMDCLGEAVATEIDYQQAIWNKDYAGALAAARDLLGKLTHQDLRGYRALWHYLAGSLAMRLSQSPGDAHSKAAKEQFSMAKRAAPLVSWLNSLVREFSVSVEEEKAHQSGEALRQIEAIEIQFESMGIATNHKFERCAAHILELLDDVRTFEQGQVELGKMLGFVSSNSESDAAPDPWWLGGHLGVVFETHADGDPETVFGAQKARQASGHPKWIKRNVPGTEDMEIHAILLTPCTKVKDGAVPQLDGVRYWGLDDFRDWASKAISALRTLKGQFSGNSDFLWRAEALQTLEQHRLTLEAIVSLPSATETMEIVG